MRTHKDLDVWHASVALAGRVEISLLTEQGDADTLQIVQEELDRIARMLQGLIRAVRSKSTQ